MKLNKNSRPKVTQREAEKPGEIRGMDSIGVQTMPVENFNHPDDVKKCLDDAQVSKECQKTNDIVLESNLEQENKILSPIEIQEDSYQGYCKSSPTAENDVTADKSQKTIDDFKNENSACNLTIVSSNVQSESPSLQYHKVNISLYF